MSEMTMLRISTLVAAGAGTLCLGFQGQLRMRFVVAALLLQLAAAAAPHLLPGQHAAKVRRSTANVLVLAASLLAAWLVLARPTGTDMGGVAGLVEWAGMLVSVPLVAVLVAQFTCADSWRELRTVLVVSLLCVLLALGTAEEAAVADLWPGLGSCLAVGWTAVLASLWLLQRAKQQQAATHVHRGWVLGGGFQLGAVVLGSVVAGLAAFALVPHPDGWHPPGWDGNTTRAGSPLWQTNGGGQAGPRNPDSYLSGRMDLNSRGDLPETRLVTVPADSPYLWAGSVLADYDGRYWSAVSHVGSIRIPPIDSAGAHDLRPGARPGAAPARAARSDDVRLLAANVSLPVIAPGQALAVQVDGHVVRDTDKTLTIAGIPHRPSSYVVRSNTEITGPATAQDGELPTSLPTRVGDLARRITRGAVTPAAKVAAIEAYLRAHYRYRLDSPVPARGEDAVDDFLFVSLQGFCEQFASAEAVLLRSVGVRTRIVTGFATGKEQGTRRVFSGTDAHAWVQVYLGGQRWVFSDPTAGVALAPDSPSWAERVASVVSAHWRSVVGWALTLLVLVPFTFFGIRRSRALRERRRVLAAPAYEQLLIAFTRLEIALAGIGLRRAPESSISELSSSLLERWPGGLPDPEATRAAMVVVERVLYDGTPVRADAALTAASTLHQLAELARSPELGYATAMR